MLGSPLEERVGQFIALVTSGRSVEAIDQFYADDVNVFENRRLARSGREACVAFETAELAKQPAPADVVARSHAVNTVTGRVFIEWQIRFETPEGRHLLLEEVSVQRWHKGRISEERFYYEGFVDEGSSE